MNKGNGNGNTDIYEDIVQTLNRESSTFRRIEFIQSRLKKLQKQDGEEVVFWAGVLRSALLRYPDIFKWLKEQTLKDDGKKIFIPKRVLEEVEGKPEDMNIKDRAETLLYLVENYTQPQEHFYSE